MRLHENRKRAWKVLSQKPPLCSIILEIQKQRGTITGLDKLRTRCRTGALGRAKPRGTYILLCENEKTLDLQIFTPTGKTMKKLLRSPNTIVNTSRACNILMFTDLVTSN